MVSNPDRPIRFIPLESNPDVFTELIHNLGVTGLKFQDVLSVDEPGLLATVARPVHSLVLIYPGDSKTELEKKHEIQGSEPYAGSGDTENAIWFRQTIHAACGLYAILHALSNGTARDLIPSSATFADLLERSIPEPPDARAKVLETSVILAEAHKKAALQGCTPAPHVDDEEPPHHYVAFVRGKNNHVFEMNGNLNGPLDKQVELNDDDDLLGEKALAVVRRFIELEEGKDPNFSLLALVPA